MHTQAFLEALSAPPSHEDTTRLTVGFGLVQQYQAIRARGVDAPVDATALVSLRTLLDPLPSLDREVTALRALADALRYWQPDPPSAFGRRLLYTALVQYGQALFGNAAAKLAVAVLNIVAVDAELDGDHELSAQARLLCGFAFRTLGEWESSYAAYERAYELAWGAGDFTVALRARVGLAYNATARGDLPRAHELLRAAARRGAQLAPDVLPNVFLAQAHLENTAERYEEAIALCYRAYQAASASEEMQYASLIDLAQHFVDYGAPDVAERALRAVLRADVDVRHRLQSQLHLLLLAGTQHREAEFDALTSELASAPFTIRQRTLYHMYVAQGLRGFGRLEQARDAATEAIALARSASLFQLMFQGEEELRRIEDAASTDAPRNVSGELEQLPVSMSRRVSRIARAIEAVLTPVASVA